MMSDLSCDAGHAEIDGHAPFFGIGQCDQDRIAHTRSNKLAIVFSKIVRLAKPAGLPLRNPCFPAGFAVPCGFSSPPEGFFHHLGEPRILPIPRRRTTPISCFFEGPPSAVLAGRRGSPARAPVCAAQSPQLCLNRLPKALYGAFLTIADRPARCSCSAPTQTLLSPKHLRIRQPRADGRD
jgi:hypothetical protein